VYFFIDGWYERSFKSWLHAGFWEMSVVGKVFLGDFWSKKDHFVVKKG